METVGVRMGALYLPRAAQTFGSIVADYEEDRILDRHVERLHDLAEYVRSLSPISGSRPDGPYAHIVSIAPDIWQVAVVRCDHRLPRTFYEERAWKLLYSQLPLHIVGNTKD